MRRGEAEGEREYFCELQAATGHTSTESIQHTLKNELPSSSFTPRSPGGAQNNWKV